MTHNVKISLYFLLTVAACLFGYFSWRNYSRLMNQVQTRAKGSAEVSSVENKSASPAYEGYSKVMTFGVLFFIMILGLALLVGHDVSQFCGNKAMKVLYNDEGEGLRDPEYERAEQEWADGHHLEAICLMREYLNKNPRELHAALRIAEIYEKDLQNHLAAALEYEDILQHNLPRERWGWAAIHLCNLYFKLAKPDQAVALLRRIDAEYGETQAAEKARKRLALYDAEGPEGSVSPRFAQENAPLDEQRGS